MPTRLGRPVREMEKGTSRGASRGALAAGLLVAGLALGGAAGFAAGRSSAPQAAPQVAAGDHMGLNAEAASVPFTARAADGSAIFGMNGSGQYFGTEGYAVEYLAGRLDLVACLGTGGERGYCYYDELQGDDAGAAVLYASDGTTVVGTFAAVDANVDGDNPPGEAEFCATSDLDGSVLFGLNPAGQHYAMENFGELYLRGGEELVAAVGRGGASGYVLRSDLERVGGGDVPVYESDGATVIDTLSS